MPVRMRIVTLGADRAGRGLSIITGKLENLEPIFRVIAQHFRDHVDEEFLTEGRGTWAPLSSGYAARKEVKWGPQPILIASGALNESLTVAGATDNVEQFESDRMRVGSRNPYLRFHQSEDGHRILPRRAPINITAKERQEWVALIEQYIATD